MFKRLLTPGILLILGVGFFLWTLSSPFWQAVMKVSAVMRLMHEEYVSPEAVSYDRLAAMAAEGMVDGLDNYSRYLSAADVSYYEEISQQQYVGLGIQIEAIEGRVTVVNRFPESPAAEAGILPGDQIVAVDGRDTRSLPVPEVSELLRGPENESVRVTLERPGTLEPLELQVTRRPVRLASVENRGVDAEGFGLIRISQFGEKTAEEFTQALDALEAQGLRGLIVDLRNNPGGLLSSAKEVAGEFFGRHELIVYLQGREPIDREEFRASDAGRSPSYPVVVLINERSASGAELVAGAWQDTRKATVVGERSHGKGSVQSVFSFRDGDGVRATTALYYLPSGRSLNEVGVEPDISVPLSPEAELQILLHERHRDLPSQAASEAPADPQLDAARQALRERLPPTPA